MTDATGTNALPLQTLSENNRPPKHRVRDAVDAQTICQTLIFANRDRARFNAKVKGMLDGNPPFNPAVLRQNAQSYRSNFNPLEGDAILASALTPYYDLFAGSQYYAQVKLRNDNPDDREYKSGVATEEFDQLLKDYPDFVFNMHAILHDLIAFGKGFAIWPTHWGWWFQHASYAKVYVPDATRASLGKLDIIVVREKFELHTLWNYISNRKTATALGWNVEATANAIRLAMPEQRTNQTGDVLNYDYIQQRMKDRDLVESQSGGKQPTVQVCHLLVKEFDGSITHMMVCEPGSVGTSTEAGSGDPRPEFLYRKEKKYANFREYTAAFFFETMDGSWNGARGLGHKIFSTVEAKTRSLNKAVDNAFISSSITLQATDATSLQKASIVQIGNINVLPPGFTVQAGNIFANSQPLYDINQLLDQTITSNTGIYRAKVEKPKGNPVTATEAEIKFQNATTLSNSGVARFYQQLDWFYTELYRRVVHGQFEDSDKSDEAEAVRMFRRECAKRGVSLDDLKKVRSVRAMRNIGNGSQINRQQALERFTPFVPMLSEAGRQNWMQDLVASEFGNSAVERYVPQREKALQPNDQQAYAAMENTDMKVGGQPLWTGTQNNVIHAAEHLKAMAGAAQSLEQGADPMEVLAFLEIAGPHTQLHLSKIEADPSRKAEFKMLSQQFGQIASFTDQLFQDVQEQQQKMQEARQAQAEADAKLKAIQNGQDPELQVEAAKAASEMKLKEMKTVHQLHLKDLAAQQKAQAHAQQLAVTDLLTAQKIRTAAAELEMRKREAAAAK